MEWRLWDEDIDIGISWGVSWKVKSARSNFGGGEGGIVCT